MKTISVEILTQEAFQEYGFFVDVWNPRHPLYKAGEPQFYPDRTSVWMGGGPIGVSVSIEKRRDRNIIEFAEYHDQTGEGFVCLDDDVLIYCGPATETSAVPLDSLRAFRVPKGTFVTLKPGVWHGCQFPLELACAHILILLAERTYAKDCTCVFLEEEQKIEIV